MLTVLQSRHDSKHCCVIGIPVKVDTRDVDVDCPSSLSGSD